MDDGFRVAPIAENVTQAGQLLADCFKIVDLAVEHDGNGAVLVIHRLLAAGGIDDGKPPVTKCETRFEVEALTIGNRDVRSRPSSLVFRLSNRRSLHWSERFRQCRTSACSFDLGAPLPGVWSHTSDDAVKTPQPSRIDRVMNERYTTAFAVLLTGLVLVGAPDAQARTLEVGAGHPYAKLSEAAGAAAPGDRILVSPGQYFDCAVLSADGVTVQGIGDASSVVLTDKTCQGKALLITTGRGITIANLTLTRARVPDGNGAGIRAEGSGLTVDGVRFINDQDGILTADNPEMTLLIRNSLFDHDGVCLAYCAHAIYAGHIASVIVQHSVFRNTRDGHDVKSRAARTEVTDCDIADGPDGTASYLIEVPNGGAVVVRGNTMEKGPRSGNHTAAIAIGMEGVDQATPEITVTGNRFTNDGDYRTAFVDNVTATEATLRNNTLHGPVDALKGDGSTR